MTLLLYIIGAVTIAFALLFAGAAIPSLLLWHKTQECRYLLNMVMRQEKLPPLRATLASGIVETSKKSDTSGVTRTQPPTAIDLWMQESLALDVKETKEYESEEYAKFVEKVSTEAQ